MTINIFIFLYLKVCIHIFWEGLPVCVHEILVVPSKGLRVWHCSSPGVTARFWGPPESYSALLWGSYSLELEPWLGLDGCPFSGPGKHFQNNRNLATVCAGGLQ